MNQTQLRATMADDETRKDRNDVASGPETDPKGATAHVPDRVDQWPTPRHRGENATIAYHLRRLRLLLVAVGRLKTCQMRVVKVAFDYPRWKHIDH